MSKFCTICGKAETATYKPFCSKRCADIDLGRWLKGGYALKGIDGDAEIPADGEPD